MRTPESPRGFYFLYFQCNIDRLAEGFLQEQGMSIDSDELRKVILFQLNRNIVVFYKKYLSILEDISKDHQIMKNKMGDHLPKNFLDNVDYLDREKYNYVRKKILDGGNEVYRELESSLNLLDFSIKQNERK